MTPSTIWCNAQLSPEAIAELKSGTTAHRLVFAEDAASNLSSGKSDRALAEAQIAFGQPDPGQILQLTDLKWIQLTSAGYTRYNRPDVREAVKRHGTVLTNSSSVYDEPCAQHVLSFMLAQARQLPNAFAAQTVGQGWIFDRLRPLARILSAEKVFFLGFGAIARRLVQLLQPFQLEMMAVRQTVRGDEPVPTYSIGELDRLLPTADHVVDVLPSSGSTDGLIDASRIALMKPGAIFYNIGRGTTVNQNALIAALRSGHLAAALLDVTDPEPLPPGHPLWTTPNCHITPHIAGGCQGEYDRLVRHFLANLRRYESNEKLADQVM